MRSVLETFDGLPSPLRRATPQRVFAENHLDGEIRKGKRGGAFCYTVLPRYTPWVLVNYAGRVRDVATLAHELGHAVHSMMASGCSNLTQHASLPLAETASVFSEMLMTDRLLREERDPLARRELLAAAVDDVYATVLRQAYFVLFEIEAHDAIRAGRSTDELSEMYMEKLREQFGDSVEVGPEFRHEWLSIPHIYQTPFYCYAYSFGQLLVLALYRRFQEEGEAFKPGYMRLLSYGGSARPEHILAEVGIDMHRPRLLAGRVRPRAGADRRARQDEAVDEPVDESVVETEPSSPSSSPIERDAHDSKRETTMNGTKAFGVALVAAGLAGLAAGPATAADLWIHVRVHGDKGAEEVAVNVPVSMARNLAGMVPDDARRSGRVRVKDRDYSLAELRRAWRELENGPDATYLTVNDPNSKVRIGKRGDYLELRADRQGGQGGRTSRRGSRCRWWPPCSPARGTSSTSTPPSRSSPASAKASC